MIDAVAGCFGSPLLWLTWIGAAWRGKAWQGEADKEGRGRARLGTDGQGEADKARKIHNKTNKGDHDDRDSEEVHYWA